MNNKATTGDLYRDYRLFNQFLMELKSCFTHNSLLSLNLSLLEQLDELFLRRVALPFLHRQPVNNLNQLTAIYDAFSVLTWRRLSNCYELCTAISYYNHNPNNALISGFFDFDNSYYFKRHVLIMVQTLYESPYHKGDRDTRERIVAIVNQLKEATNKQRPEFMNCFHGVGLHGIELLAEN